MDFRQSEKLNSLVIAKTWTIKDLTFNRYCINCGQKYQEINNIGQWQCRQHALEFDKVKGYWPCCSSKSKYISTNGLPHGCVRADHINNQEYFYRDIDDIKLSLLQMQRALELIPLNEESIINKNNMIIIKRYDKTDFIKRRVYKEGKYRPYY